MFKANNTMFYAVKQCCSRPNNVSGCPNIVWGRPNNVLGAETMVYGKKQCSKRGKAQESHWTAQQGVSCPGEGGLTWKTDLSLDCALSRARQTHTRRNATCRAVAKV